MEVIITRPTTQKSPNADVESLAEQLKLDFPSLKFESGDDFMWSPVTKTVKYKKITSETDAWSLLHETAHASLNHSSFKSDIELLEKEVEAWDHAFSVIAPNYTLKITRPYIEKQLDSYRDWLHLRSLCPNCNQTGIQTKTSHYGCINCNDSWSVNDARRCNLRRYSSVSEKPRQ